ncbi:MAG: ADP-ribosylglycohydrolase family protein, partial [Lentisphaeria bacterium]|nr:ADP-ribosylglycohydrolase family protein [Lentisphaeria bacterium]
MNYFIMRAQMKKLAEKYHAGQFRKGPGNIPYIVHPEAVVKTLLRWGTDTHRTFAIAWGHDLLEDTTVSDEEIIEAADEYVLKAIRILTCPEGMPKSAYLEKIVKHGNSQVLLVKIADRICNTKDFIKLKGKLYAFQYLHQVDPLIAALKTKKESFTTANALKAFEELDNELRPDAQREMIRGCLAGGAVGDALGSPVEFFSEEMIKKKYAGPVQEYVEFQDGTGAITDDTQMTLFTAEGILRAAVRYSEKGICAPEKVVQNAYMRWLKTQGYTPTASEEILNSGWLIKEKQLFVQRAPGMTCLNSLNDPAEDAKARNDSKGCGTVMRMAPAGLFFSPECAYHYGCLFSAITHGHPTGITAGGAFALLIAYLLEGESLE